MSRVLMWGMKDMVEGCVETIVIITASLSLLRESLYPVSDR